MNKKSSRYRVLSGILAVMLCMCGCGKGNSGASNQKGVGISQEEISYVTQSLSLPACDAFDAYSDGNDLYYIATLLNQDSQQYETAFYTLRQGAAEPERIFCLPENQMVSSMTMDTEGNIYYTSYGIVPGDDEDNQTPPSSMLYKLDQDGVMQLTLDLSSYTQGQEQITIGDLAVDGERCIVLSASNQSIFVLDQSGQLLFTTRADGRVFDMCRSNGKVLVGYAEGSRIAIKEIDVSAKKLSSKLEPDISGNQFYMASGTDGNLLIATEENVYRYNYGIKEVIKKFDWQTYHTIGITTGILMPYGENGVLAISRNYSTYPIQIEVTAFREAAEGEVILPAEKTVITLGTLYALPSGLNAEVVYFNKANPDISIEVKNYNEDYTRFVTEVMAGNGPDIVVMPSREISDQFAGKGAVEDLQPYFEADKTLNRSDFLENILNAFETDGHLYWMPACYLSFSTVIGKTSAVGEESGWNLDELIAYAESAPNKGLGIFDNSSKSGVLSLLKYAYSDQLVDTDNASNPLNRELLMKMLAFANRYENDDQYVLDTNLMGRMREEQAILVDTGVRMGHEYFADTGIFGEPVTFMGYPAEEKNGNMISCYSTFAINSGSEHKDIAWKFISTLLSEEAGMRMVKDFSTMGFYMRKDVLEYHLTWIAGHSNSQALVTRSGNYVEYKFDSAELQEEDVEPIRNMILNANMVLRISPELDQIIKEEAAYYFNGTKPIEEVVDVIENKVRTYVNEMK